MKDTITMEELEDTMVLQGELVADAENETRELDSFLLWGGACFICGAMFGSLVTVVVKTLITVLR
jgi:hypothetical protein